MRTLNTLSLLFLSLPVSTHLCCLALQLGGDERRVDSRTIYVGHRSSSPGEPIIKFCDNRIVSSKVRNAHTGSPSTGWNSCPFLVCQLLSVFCSPAFKHFSFLVGMTLGMNSLCPFFVPPPTFSPRASLPSERKSIICVSRWPPIDHAPPPP